MWDQRCKAGYRDARKVLTARAHVWFMSLRNLPRLMLIVVAMLLLAPTAHAHDRLGFNDLPERIRNQLFDLSRRCSLVGGTPGNPMDAVGFADFDQDGMPDIIVDESRFPCGGFRPGTVCVQPGCRVYVTLSQNGRWRPVFDVVGSYCIDFGRSPPDLITIQRNFLADGSMTIINIRYEFRRGMAFQRGLDTCEGR